VYAKADLKAAVAAGQITQEQADDIWAKQRDPDHRESRAEALERRSGDGEGAHRLRPSQVQAARARDSGQGFEERRKIVTKFNAWWRTDCRTTSQPNSKPSRR
jgi:hypothetical protein